ncbi:hypothetical protein [Magnetofaba australis]|uniref:hypothetical protein n=1 Tax=Magnetofaba australis TaxID=1472297 RepID=UPI000A19FBA2|nr:hypothetical protein [Magnetofaba australis]
MSDQPDATPVRRQRRKKQGRTYAPCVACKTDGLPFAWTCRACDFVMCQECMQENLWGMTCNNLTWTCPDCGTENNFGQR